MWDFVADVYAITACGLPFVLLPWLTGRTILWCLPKRGWFAVISAGVAHLIALPTMSVTGRLGAAHVAQYVWLVILIGLALGLVTRAYLAVRRAPSIREKSVGLPLARVVETTCFAWALIGPLVLGVGFVLQ
jgi:hypothetical protein